MTSSTLMSLCLVMFKDNLLYHLADRIFLRISVMPIAWLFMFYIFGEVLFFFLPGVDSFFCWHFFQRNFILELFCSLTKRCSLLAALSCLSITTIRSNVLAIRAFSVASITPHLLELRRIVWGFGLRNTVNIYCFHRRFTLFERRIFGENEALSDSIKSFNSKWSAHLSNKVLVCILRRVSVDETLLVRWPYGRPFSQCYSRDRHENQGWFELIYKQ